MVTRRALLKALPLSYLASAFAADASAPSSLTYGYAAITWGKAFTEAIDDIAAVGFHGIQLRAADGIVERFGQTPSALRDLLARSHLSFAALSSGNLVIDPAREQEQLATHTAHARFLREAGGRYLQVIDERPKGRAVVDDDYVRVGRLLTKLGTRTQDLGVTLVYHHHMNSVGEKPHEIAAVLAAADRRHVRLLFDCAHYLQGGGDPAAAIRQYRDWIELLHLKDVRAAPAEPGGYQWVELGRGRVDLPAVFGAIRDIGYTGPAIVELDRVPDANRTPKQCAEINRRYLVDVMHQKV
jgi:inosose dehydratase